MPERKIVVIGAGPTGLGAAYRLQELGHRNWKIFEQHDYVGGLAASFRDEKDFTWDIGGHILFSHYPYFDALYEKLLKSAYLSHVRNSWIWMQNRFVRYPFQNNLHYLPNEMLYECLRDLINAQTQKAPQSRNFGEWLVATFGEAIAHYFLLPYNFKTWATPPELMAKDWIAERVSVIPLDTVLRNVIFKTDDTTWGPNATFKFPRKGGTGDLFTRFVPYIKPHLTLGKKAVQVDIEKKQVHFEDGAVEPYDYLISTMPVDLLVDMMRPSNASLKSASRNLVYASGLIVGIGIRQKCPSDKCWMYFPEDNSPFYRVTYFSNYSPNNVPGEAYFSFMCETSYSKYKPAHAARIIDNTIEGLMNTHLMDDTMKDKIESTSLIDVERSYPVPSLKRDAAIKKVIPFLEKERILSRGRFGLWLYEIGNMDHSVMQGVEAVDRILKRKKEIVVAPFLR